VQAIETIYKGYRFRSRLEARWAVFFDACGVTYQYEPEGFEAEGERYLPDFYLPDSDVWVEVKGDPEAVQKDWRRMATILDVGKACRGGLLLLGDIPYLPVSAGDPRFVMHPLIRHYKGLVRDWVSFVPDGVEGAQFKGGRLWQMGEVSSGMRSLLNLPLEVDIQSGPGVGWLVEHRFLRTDFDLPRVVLAYAKARAARFEHGETPEG